MPRFAVMSGRAVFEVDLAATRRRISRLRRYVSTNLLTDDLTFVCEHHRECRRSIRPGDVFREGTMSHVGHRFDLRRNGRPLRVVVVGQESGWARGAGAQRRGRRVSLDERYFVIHDRSGLSRSYYVGDGRDGRNPHMRGTTSALRIIFDRGLGTGHEDEFVTPLQGRSFHIFDGFALVNRLLCSAGPVNSSQGRSSPTMRDRCEEHFAATLSILEPTLIVLQGDAVRRWSAEVLVPTRVFSENLYRAALDDRQLLVAAFSHPAAHGPLRWGDSLAAPYLTGTVVPTLRAAMRQL